MKDRPFSFHLTFPYLHFCEGFHEKDFHLVVSLMLNIQQPLSFLLCTFAFKILNKNVDIKDLFD